MNNILVVEDDPGICELLEMGLSTSGYHCSQATTGKQALEIIEQQPFDLALMDIMLPELDGYELLPFMQRKNIPVIYISAKGDIADRVRGLRLGAEVKSIKVCKFPRDNQATDLRFGLGPSCSC